MKTLSLVPACLAATLFLAPVVVRGADATTASDGSAAETDKAAARQAEILKRFDKNGDGKLDEDEKAAAKSEMRGKRGAAATKIHDRILERFDKNHDGLLDETERAAALSALADKPRFIKLFDKDGDGKLSPAERAAAEQALSQRFGQKKN